MKYLMAVALTVIFLTGCATAKKDKCPEAVIRVGSAGNNLGYVN